MDYMGEIRQSIHPFILFSLFRFHHSLSPLCHLKMCDLSQQVQLVNKQRAAVMITKAIFISDKCQKTNGDGHGGETGSSCSWTLGRHHW